MSEWVSQWVSEWVTKVGIELLGQLKTDKNRNLLLKVRKIVQIKETKVPKKCFKSDQKSSQKSAKGNSKTFKVPKKVHLVITCKVQNLNALWCIYYQIWSPFLYLLANFRYDHIQETLHIDEVFYVVQVTSHPPWRKLLYRGCDVILFDQDMTTMSIYDILIKYQWRLIQSFQ